MQARTGGIFGGLCALWFIAGACGHDTYAPIPPPECVAGKERDCYDGQPDGTWGVGACTVGTQRCKEDESGWGECMGQGARSDEICDNGVDDDCDGRTDAEDDDCTCIPGTVQACETEGLGICRDGTQECSAHGKWSDCAANHLPQSADDCSNDDDDDCDGKTCAGPVWGHAFGDDAEQTPLAVASDKEENVYVVGKFKGTMSVGPFLLTSAMDEDGFVIKLNNQGEPRWVKSFGGIGSEAINAVAVDSLGDVVIAGTFTSPLTVETTSGKKELKNYGGMDILFAKLTGDEGKVKWANSRGLDDDQVATSVAIDPRPPDRGGDDILVAGWFKGTLVPGFPPSEGKIDAFVMRFNPEGNGNQPKQFGGSEDAVINSVAVDRNGDVVVVGSFRGALTFNKQMQTGTSSIDDQNAFIAKLGDDGSLKLIGNFGDAESQEANAVAIDAGNGDIVFAGTTHGSIPFNGSGVKIDVPGGGPAWAFAIKLNKEGAPLWARPFGDGTNDTHTFGAAIDVHGNIALTGDFAGSVDFGGGGMTAAGSPDAYLVKLDPNGGYLWSRKLGSANEANQGQAVAFTPESRVILTTRLKGNVPFGPSGLTSAGGTDIGVMVFEP